MMHPEWAVVPFTYFLLLRVNSTQIYQIKTKRLFGVLTVQPNLNAILRHNDVYHLFLPCFRSGTSIKLLN